jgi:hypothetical protein
MIQMFRKKPVVIEAVQIHRITDEESVTDYLARNEGIANWCGGVSHMLSNEADPHFIIHTLEGDMKASAEDWIIKGVNGEFYPCKPDIFEKTYEPVDQ